MDRFFQILTDGVHRFEGTVDQFTGDGIMAIFGAPIAHEDHAQRACYAALHLRDELRQDARLDRRLDLGAEDARAGLLAAVVHQHQERGAYLTRCGRTPRRVTAANNRENVRLWRGERKISK